jgi:hypothetical protein
MKGRTSDRGSLLAESAIFGILHYISQKKSKVSFGLALHFTVRDILGAIPAVNDRGRLKFLFRSIIVVG